MKIACPQGKPLLMASDGIPACLHNYDANVFVHANDGTLCGPWCRQLRLQPDADCAVLGHAQCEKFGLKHKTGVADATPEA